MGHEPRSAALDYPGDRGATFAERGPGDDYRVCCRQPGVALARLWLRQADADCPHCSSSGKTGGESLHLRASAGTPQLAATDWSRTDGTFHRIPLDRGDLKISHIGTSGQSVRIPRLSEDRQWVRNPEWARDENLVGFAGHPICLRGTVVGVLAVFRRTEPDDECWDWLRVLADSAAVAIANARAFEQVEALRRELELERDYLRQEVQENGVFGEILGRSASLQRVLRQVDKVAATDASVLILGETGSGKELVARGIHQRSPRAHKPLVKVNCGSIPRELFESEFFGHVRGSFTGAIRDRVGRFQLADGGTLFLDEVGENPLELQSKLLRVLQEGEYERVGNETTRKVNVRVLSATNKDLRQLVQQGLFREDLYYRLNVVPLRIPPLRERIEDVPDLIRHFLNLAASQGLPRKAIDGEALTRLRRYSWPGNVRELENLAQRLAALYAEDTINARIVGLELDPTDRREEMALPETATLSAAVEVYLQRHFTEHAAAGLPPDGLYDRIVEEVERPLLVAALVATKGNQIKAAKLLGLNRNTLRKKIKHLNVTLVR